MVLVEDVIAEVGQLGLWLQAIGIAVVLVIVFNVISFFYNKKRLKQIAAIRRDMERIEGKIDKLVKQKK